MAGHSQFKNIMHRKGAQDARKAKIFSKLAREIMVAAKGGPDPASNARLRLAITTARAQSMPKDNIERAIKKSQGGDMETYEEVRYEGRGPGGTAIIVEALTDNRNRTVSDIRTLFSKNGGSLGETGSVSYNFDRVGLIVYPAKVAAEDVMFEAAVEAGAENVESSDQAHEVYTDTASLHQVASTLAAKFGDAGETKLVWKAKDGVPVDEEQATKLIKLLDALEDNDDVQNVFGNYQVDDAVMAKIAG